jgi:hypothetical protein
MRALAVVLAVLTCCSAAAATNGVTALRITIWNTPDTTPRVFTLRCNPPQGTVGMPTAACARLERVGRALFAPTPPGTACTMIYGGPQRAVIAGTLDGRKLWASFRRRDGCEIARWNKVAFLLGTA